MESINFRYNWGKFYWDAWLNDINLQSCDLAAQGLWINLIAIMHKSDRTGYLVINGRPMTVFDIAKRVGIRKDRAERLLQKLIQNDVCSVTDDGILYCRRIVRDEKRRSRNMRDTGVNINLKKGDNQFENEKNSYDYRLRSQGEQDAIKYPFLHENIKHGIQNIGITQDMVLDTGSFKRDDKKNYIIEGTRLPLDWSPDAKSYQYAFDLGLCPEQIAEDFCDYWHAKVGKGAVKMDWSATWRRWCRVASQEKLHSQFDIKKKVKFFMDISNGLAGSSIEPLEGR